MWGGDARLIAAATAIAGAEEDDVGPSSNSDGEGEAPGEGGLVHRILLPNSSISFSDNINNNDDDCNGDIRGKDDSSGRRRGGGGGGGGAKVKDFDVGQSHILLLTTTNEVWACGDNAFGQLGLGLSAAGGEEGEWGEGFVGQWRRVRGGWEEGVERVEAVRCGEWSSWVRTSGEG